MPTLHAVLNRKPDSAVHSIAPAATVLDAANLMNDHRIGALLVLDQGGSLVGIFTERDVLRRVVAEGRDPATATVSEVMTSPVVTVPPTTKTPDARRLFQQRRIRHLPVLNEAGAVLGLVSIGDLNAHELADTRTVVDALQTVLYGQT